MAIKILVDAHVFDGLHQGSRTYLKGLYSNFTDDRFEVFYAGRNIKNLKNEFPNVADKNFIRLKSKNKFIRLSIEFPFIIRKHGFDYAHFNYVLPLFINKKCKYINTLHDVLFLDFPKYFSKTYITKNKLLFKRSTKHTDVLLTVSKYSRDRISEHFKIPKSEINITPNAVNPIYKKPIDKELSKKIIKQKYNITKYILFVSRIEPRKNHVSLVDAFINLKLYNENYTLVFSGKKEGYDKYLEEKISQLKSIKKDAFVHIEDLNEQEIIHFYNGAEICVFPSFCEGFGIPPLESGCLKTTTICSNQTAMSDFTFFKENLFNPYAANELENKIKTALSQNPVNLDQVAEKINEKYNWENSRKALIDQLI